MRSKTRPGPNSKNPSPRHTPAGHDFELQALEPRVLMSGASVLPEALYMPEGFSAPTAVQVVELAYADDSGSADWQLWAHYERDGSGDEIVCIAEGTLGAGDTDRIAVWGDGAALVRADEPYSLVLRSSTDDVTALLRHSDFGAQTAQYFSDRGEDDFILAGVRRDDDASREFVVFFNNNDDDVTVELELRDDSGNTYRYTAQVEAQRRGGWNIQQLPDLPEGVYQARVTSDSAIVLGGTRYALERQAATIELPAQSTARAGVILDAEFDTDDDDRDDTFLFIANPGSSDVEVRFRAFAGDDGPLVGPTTFTVMVEAGGSERISLRGEGFTDDDDDVTLAYVADAPVAINVISERRGQIAFYQPETRASDAWFFDQGLIEDIDDDEIETEDVLLFNPGSTAVNVTVTFTFSDGTRIVENKTLASLEVEDVDGEIEFDEGFFFPLDGLDFTISITSTGPIVAMLEHWNPLGRALQNTALGVPTGTVADLVDIAVF